MSEQPRCGKAWARGAGRSIGVFFFLGARPAPADLVLFVTLG